MTLSREEMALALYPTLLTTYAHDPEAAARRAVQHADALLLALTHPTPAPVAPPAGKYEPATGLAVPPPAPTPAPEVCCASPLCPHPPAPEAKRPEWVRIVKSESPSRFKDGDVLRVVKWVDEVPAVDVDGYDVSGYVLYDSKWAPAPCPPPVAGSAETLPDNVREFLLDVEYAAKWANQPQGPAAEYVKGRLKELAALAHDILSRPVRP